jgi:hypothetical protein
MGQDARTVISIAIAAAAAVAIFGGPFAAAGPRPVPLVVLFKGAGSMQTAAAAAAEAGTPLAASGNSAPLALRADATRVSLAPPQVKGQAGLSVRLRALAPEDQIYLILQKLGITGATAIGYDVFFDLPAGDKPDIQNPHYVGNFNFFDTESGQRNAVFNITDLVRSLAGNGTLGEQPTVTIVPTGQLEADAKPTIDKAVVVAVPQ